MHLIAGIPQSLDRDLTSSTSLLDRSSRSSPEVMRYELLLMPVFIFRLKRDCIIITVFSLSCPWSFPYVFVKHVLANSPPKPIFLHESGLKKSQLQRQRSQQDQMNPQHRELVKYIHETWKCVKQEYDTQGSLSAQCLSQTSAGHTFRRPSVKSMCDFKCILFLFSFSLST